MSLAGAYIFVYKGHFQDGRDHQTYADRDPTPTERLALDECGAFSVAQIKGIRRQDLKIFATLEWEDSPQVNTVDFAEWLPLVEKISRCRRIRSAIRDAARRPHRDDNVCLWSAKSSTLYYRI